MTNHTHISDTSQIKCSNVSLLGFLVAFDGTPGSLGCGNLRSEILVLCVRSRMGLCVLVVLEENRVVCDTVSELQLV